MENQTQFDLETAVAGWRKRFLQTAAFAAADVAELECHLRDSCKSLEAAGLSPAEAFLIASQRIGSREKLEGEYSKENPSRVWLDRIMWMIIGVEASCFILAFSRIATGGLLFGTYMLFPGNPEIRRFGLLGHIVALAGVVGLFVWLFGGKHATRSRLAALVVNRPYVSGVSLVLLAFSIQTVSVLLAFMILPPGHPDLANVPQQWTSVSSMILQIFVLPCALIWVCRKRAAA